jgi:hypothetical protein
MRIERRSSIRARFARAARVTTYCGVVSVVLSLVAARQVRADVLEATGETSSVLAQLGELPELGAGLSRLSVNGESVHVAAAVVPGSIDDVVRAIEKSCRADVQGLESLSARPPASRPELDLASIVFDAARSVTTRTAGGATVLCVADTDATRDESPGRRLDHFVTTGDIAALGSLRHFALTSVPTGTRVIAAWLPSRFPLDRVFPASGDAPGSDATGVPRPDNSRRVLTAGAEGYPNVIRVYESGETNAGDFGRRYDDALRRAGWRPHDGVGERLPPMTTVYGLGERDLFVQVRADARSGRVFVSTVDMRASRVEK